MKKTKKLTMEDFKYNALLIWDLAKNDFKNKFAGSVLGIIWAFVQPVVTIMVYWFVFQVGFRQGAVSQTGVPYSLWLSAGLIPWFFFSESWSGATNSLNEYNYLVKKVVFNITAIPLVKIFSALFVHVFFVCFLMFMFLINGVSPSLYWFQVIYYSLCMFLLVVSVSYFTSALYLFFRDILQMISILLQVGVWLTPIMWQIDMIPAKFQWIFKLNPMYYVVVGYRNSLIDKVGFWEDVKMNLYFWGLQIVLFLVGTGVFRKLKPHFADVL